MALELPSIRSKLSRIEFETAKNGGKTIAITLTGHEMAIATDYRILEAQAQDDIFGYLFVERSNDNKSLTVRATMPPNSNDFDFENLSAIFAYKIYDLTRPGLGGMKLKPVAVPVFNHGDGESLYSAAVLIEPHIDPTDKRNMLGKYCQEIIRRHHTWTSRNTIHDNRVQDPQMRFLDITRQFDTEREALNYAERCVMLIENDFAIYYNKPMNLFLSELHTKPLDLQTRKEIDLYKGALNANDFSVTRAKLQGSDDMLSKAEIALYNLFPPNIFKQQRNDDSLDVLLCGDNHSDPARLLSMVHGRTRCRLPMDINAAVLPDPHQSSKFNPCLETEVWHDDTPEEGRGTLGTALARYVGSQIPDASIIVPQQTSKNQEYGNARIIISRHCDSAEQAQEIAEDLKETVSAKLKRGGGLQL